MRMVQLELRRRWSRHLGAGQRAHRTLRRGDAAVHQPDRARDIARGAAESSAFSICSSTAPVSLWVQAVSIGPGETQLALTPYGACSTATPAMNAWRNAF